MTHDDVDLTSPFLCSMLSDKQLVPNFEDGRNGHIIPYEGCGWVALPDDPVRRLNGRQGRSGVHEWEMWRENWNVVFCYNVRDGAVLDGAADQKLRED